jgi:GDPmannose 4,6-dehydratase
MWLSLQQREPQDLVIATGVGHSVRDLVRVAFAAAEIDDWEDRVVAERDESEPWSVGDPSRARSALGWAPEVDFQELVRMMVLYDLETV